MRSRLGALLTWGSVAGSMAMVLGASSAAADESREEQRQILNYVVRDAPKRGINTTFNANVNEPERCRMHLGIGLYENLEQLPSSEVLLVDLVRLKPTVRITEARADQLWSHTLHLECRDQLPCFSVCQGPYLECFVDPEYQTFTPNRRSLELWAWNMGHAQETASKLESEIRSCAGYAPPRIDSSRGSVQSQVVDLNQRLGRVSHERFAELRAQARKESPEYLPLVFLLGAANSRLESMLDSAPNAAESLRIDELCDSLVQIRRYSELVVVRAFQLTRYADVWSPSILVRRINGLAAVLGALDEPELAEAWFQVALQKSEAVWGKDSTQVADAHAMLALFLTEDAARPFRAAESLDRAFAIHEQSDRPRPKWWGEVLFLRSQLQLATGQDDLAKKTLRRIVSESGTTSAKVRCLAWLMLSKLALETGNLDRALAHAEAATQAAGGDEELEEGTQQVLADVYAKRGEVAKALAIVRPLSKHSSKAARRESDYLLLQGNVAAARRALARAGVRAQRPSNIDRAVDSWTSPADFSLWFADQRRLALLREAEGAADSALASYLELQKALEAFMRMTADGDPARAALWEGLEARNGDAVSFAVRNAAKGDKIRRFALETAMRSKARALDTQRAELTRGRSDTARQERLAAAITGISAARVVGSKDAIDAALLRFHGSMEDHRGSIQPVDPLPTSVADAVQSKLRPGQALLEYVEFNPHSPGTARFEADDSEYAALVLLPSGEPQVVTLGAKGRIDSLVERFVAELADAKPSYVSLAHELHQALIDPVLPKLGSARSVYLSPVGSLHQVPFAAFVNENDEFALSRWRFTYLSSARDLLRTTKEGSALSAPVVVADPAYGPDVSNVKTGLQGGYRPLRQTRKEAELIRELLPEARLLLGPAASETKVKALESPSILYVATHGYFLPVRSSVPGAQGAMTPAGVTISRLTAAGLALAGANGEGTGSEDGLLTSGELSIMDLGGTQLVVLSSCGSGVGGASLAAGVEGLRRAISLAGAESQLVSLWAVQDEPTRKLMRGFLERLLSGAPRATALRRAQLDLAAAPEWNHPFYWSSFILVGKESALDGTPGGPVQVDVRRVVENSAPLDAVISPGSSRCSCEIIASGGATGIPGSTASLFVFLACCLRRRTPQ